MREYRLKNIYSIMSMLITISHVLFCSITGYDNEIGCLQHSDHPIWIDIIKILTICFNNNVSLTIQYP